MFLPNAVAWAQRPGCAIQGLDVGFPKWMWILLSSVVMTLGPELLDLCSCQWPCRSGITRNTACPPTTSTGSVARDPPGAPVVTETIWMGDMARSGVMDPDDSGVMARE